jgi:hypothetical protein
MRRLSVDLILSLINKYGEEQVVRKLACISIKVMEERAK